MPDRVWPVSDPPPLSSFNGFGSELKGFTRADASGRCFATCWVTALGLPLLPVRRLYVRQGRTSFESFGLRSTTITRYAIDGQSRLRPIELARTYGFCWLLGPVIVLGPALGVLLAADLVVNAFEDPSAGVVVGLIAAFVGCLLGGMLALVFLLDAYRKRWAPVREAVWVDPPAPKDWQVPLAERRALRDWDWDD